MGEKIAVLKMTARVYTKEVLQQWHKIQKQIHRQKDSCSEHKHERSYWGKKQEKQHAFQPEILLFCDLVYFR